MRPSGLGQLGMRVGKILLAALSGCGSTVLAQAVADPQVAKGIREVDDGEFEAAILTLDSATRRLAADPKATRDLAEAYLYLGVAYLGKGAETSAKAQFREALARARDLKLSPEKFAPKVIELFERARDEVSARPAASASPTPAPSVGPRKTGGASKALLIGGGVIAAGAAAAFAAAGGGGNGAAPSTTASPAAGTRTQTFGPFSFTPDHTECCPGPVTVTRAGTLNIVVTWQDPTALFRVSTLPVDGNTQPSATSPNSVPPATRIEFPVQVGPGNFSFSVYRQPGGNAAAIPATLTVTYPFQ